MTVLAEDISVEDTNNINQLVEEKIKVEVIKEKEDKEFIDKEISKLSMDDLGKERSYTLRDVWRENKVSNKNNTSLIIDFKKGK
jgi:hypothetical protein